MAQLPSIQITMAPEAAEVIHAFIAATEHFIEAVAKAGEIVEKLNPTPPAVDGFCHCAEVCEIIKIGTSPICPACGLPRHRIEP
jgi:hypothetical protein